MTVKEYCGKSLISRWGNIARIINITAKEYCRKSSVSQWINIAGNHKYHSEGILQEITNITVKEYCGKSSISHWTYIAGNHQYHREIILQEIINITVKEYCRKSSLSYWFTPFSLYRLQLQDWSFHRFWGSSVGVNSSNLLAILFIYHWDVLQAAGSTPANINLWHKVQEIWNHIKNRALQVTGMWSNIFWQIGKNILNIFHLQR